MNMPSLNRLTGRLTCIVLLIAAVFFGSGCKKETTYDDVYELESFRVLPPNAGKLKLKTDEQYVTILYANFFQEAISAGRLAEITDAIYSVGDKQLAREMVVSNFMNDPGIKLPTDAFMRQNTDKFLEEAYKRFYVRNISESERAWFKNYISSNPDVTVEFIYAAFALSNEYQFY